MVRQPGEIRGIEQPTAYLKASRPTLYVFARGAGYRGRRSASDGASTKTPLTSG